MKQIQKIYTEFDVVSVILVTWLMALIVGMVIGLVTGLMIGEI